MAAFTLSRFFARCWAATFRTFVTYEERSVCEVDAFGACSVAGATGTYFIRYGMFMFPICMF